MLILNLTYQGLTTRFHLHGEDASKMTDDELVRLAAQTGRESKRWPAMELADLYGYVVDRMPGRATVYSDEVCVFVRPSKFQGEF
jgi:hypothetical protein